MRPSELLRKLVVELCRPSVLVRDGVALSYRDLNTTTDVYLQWICVLVDLDYLTSVSDRRPLHRIWQDICRSDVLDVLGGMAECLSSVINKSSYGFKARCAKISTHLYPLIRGDFEKVISSDVWAAKRLIQLFSYSGRLSLSDLDLTQQLEQDFLSVEENIPPLDKNNPLIDLMTNFVTRWIGPWLGEDLVPRHGPGGISELGRCTISEKYRLLCSDKRLEYAFGQPWWSLKEEPLVREARVVFVAKSYKTQRVISMEPCTLQYFQQGVWRRIDKVVRSNRFLSKRVDFHDQTRNQKLAQQGSIGRNYATIDLSSASDSVSYDLVKYVFRKTWLLRYIVATRSTHTKLPSGRIVDLKKFAPMGSALCFPIETLIFASICAAVAQRSQSPLDFSVFGDDIIVPTQHAESVIEALRQFGFTVNQSKSYWSAQHWYRESCGSEFCDGFDVTPMRVSRKYAHKDDKIRIQKWISQANEAYERNFPILRQFFLTKIQKSRLLPLFAPNFLKSDNYTNYHLKSKWSSDYQHVMVKAHQEVACHREDDLDDEEIRLRYWLEISSGREFLDEPISSKINGSKTSYRMVWLPHPDARSDFACNMMPASFRDLVAEGPSERT